MSNNIVGSTILVTGGFGFIGSHLVEKLLQYNVKKIIIIDNLYTGSLEIYKKFKKIDCIDTYINDIIFEQTFDVILNMYNVDYIFHLAAEVNVSQSMKTPQNTYNINVGGFNNVIEFARKANVKKMIYASSSAVYGNKSFGSSIKETSAKYPLSPYGLSKYSNEIFAEKYLVMFNLSSVGLRFFNVYGKRQKVDSEYSGVISIFNNKMSQSTNPSIYGDGEQVRDFIFVDDVVNALVASIYCSNGSYIFNVGTGKKTTINQLYLLLGEIYGFYIKPNYKKPRVGDIRGSIANLDGIKSELNWIPKTNLSDGLLKL